MTGTQDWTAVVLAAGKGTRMKSALPKVLHPLLGRPMLSWVLQAATDAGAGRLAVVVGFGRDRIVETVGAEFPQATFVLQEEQRGTGHAVLCCREALSGVDGPILILCGDTPLIQAATLRQFLGAHRSSGAAASALTFRADNPHGYGRIVRDQAGNLAKIVEQKDATPQELEISEVNAGVYAVGAQELFHALGCITPQNAQGEYYLPDIVAVLSSGGSLVRAHRVSEATDFRGINHRGELAELTEVLRRRRNTQLMLDGVTLESPGSTHVEWSVTLESDTVLEPGVRLEGRTRVAQGCRVGTGSVLKDSTLLAGAVVRPYCVLDGARVGPGAIVGPFAHLRPGADIGAAARVGNFVEVKNVKLGERSKAMHLTYLGDAEIGAGTNIGAGTITCNYDGQTKHHTTIGDDCFVGSDSVLVAPIEIGPGAYVAAGSVLTRNVPSRALGIGRARQENKPGYRDVLDRRRGLRSAGEDAGSATTVGEGTASEPEGSTGA